MLASAQTLEGQVGPEPVCWLERPEISLVNRRWAIFEKGGVTCPDDNPSVYRQPGATCSGEPGEKPGDGANKGSICRLSASKNQVSQKNYKTPPRRQFRIACHFDLNYLEIFTLIRTTRTEKRNGSV